MNVILKDIFLAAVNAVKPRQLVTNNKLLNFVHIKDQEFIDIKTKNENLRIEITNKKIHIVGFGKGVLSLCREFESFLGEKLCSGILSCPVDALKYHSLRDDSERIQVFEGAAGNLPDENALHAAKMIKSRVESLGSDDLLFVLVTGGGSALLPLPIEPITLNEKSQLIKQLSRAGATINELNTVRIAISQVKGGKLAEMGKNAHRIVSFIISDIVGDPLDLIASGPTIIQPQKQSPSVILEKYNLLSSLSPSICDTVMAIKRTTNNDDEDTLVGAAKTENCHSRTRAILIGNNRTAIDAAMERAVEYNLSPVFMSSEVQGDVVDVCRAFFDLSLLITNFHNLPRHEFVEQIENITKILSPHSNFANDLVASLEGCCSGRICIISGGETTVKVEGDGLGGRNQELALRFTQTCLEHHHQHHEHESLNDLWLLSAGTDGFDGNNAAAGALGGLGILSSLQNRNRNQLKDFINRHDSYNFYKKYAGDCYHIITGHTGTNVMDIHLLMITPKPEVIIKPKIL